MIYKDDRFFVSQNQTSENCTKSIVTNVVSIVTGVNATQENLVTAYFKNVKVKLKFL